MFNAYVARLRLGAAQLITRLADVDGADASALSPVLR